MDDSELRRRLQEIEDLAGSAALNADEFDILPVRTEIEDAEERLSTFMRELREAVLNGVEANRAAIQDLHSRVDELANSVDSMRMELPDA
jgi:predicted  nucleic acid-binding Zn-ribbon protein